MLGPLAGDGALPHALVERLDVGGEGGAVEEPVVERSACRRARKRGAARRIVGERDDGRAVGVDVAAHQLGQARGVQQARGDALGEGRGPRA